MESFHMPFSYIQTVISATEIFKNKKIYKNEVYVLTLYIIQNIIY